MLIEIKHWNGNVLHTIEADNLWAAIVALVKAGADLSRANLFMANLSGVNLSGADLYGANHTATATATAPANIDRD